MDHLPGRRLARSTRLTLSHVSQRVTDSMHCSWNTTKSYASSNARRCAFANLKSRSATAARINPRSVTPRYPLIRRGPTAATQVRFTGCLTLPPYPPSIMSIVAFEDSHCSLLAPITHARLACSIHCASYTLLDLLSQLGEPAHGMVRPHLQTIQKIDFPELQPMEEISAELASTTPRLLLNARIAPTRSNFASLQRLLQVAPTEQTTGDRLGPGACGCHPQPSVDLQPTFATRL
jgi:hypothetical protein